MIYTSYFAKLKSIPKSVVPIAICNYMPKGWDGLVYYSLAPEDSLFKDFKYGRLGKFEVSESEFRHRYERDTLALLRANEVVEELYSMSQGKDIVLVCFEKTGDICHRNYVAVWLRHHGFHCEEWHENSLRATHKILETEIECVKRNDGVNCDRKCEKCDLLLPANVILKAYDNMCDLLKEAMRGE